MWEKKCFLESSRRRNFYGEVASEWFGSYSLSWFSGIILSSSPYPLQLIKGEDFSWRKLALVSFGAFGIVSLVRVALRFALSRYIVSSIRSMLLELLEWKCVGNEGKLEGTLWHQGHGCNLSFTFNMILSYKACCVLLYDSLITYIGLYWVYVITITLVGCILL